MRHETDVQRDPGTQSPNPRKYETGSGSKILPYFSGIMIVTVPVQGPGSYLPSYPMGTAG